MWYHLCNLKNVKNIRGEVILSVKLQAEFCNFTQINTSSWGLFMFFKYKNSTKSRKASHIRVSSSHNRVIKDSEAPTKITNKCEESFKLTETLFKVY